MNKTICILIGGCLAFTACQPMVVVGQGAHTRAVALAPPGEVVVTVVGPSGSQTVQINQDPVPAVDDRHQPGMKTVRWDLATPGFRFVQPPPPSSSGIVICPTGKPCTPRPEQLTCSHAPTTVVCKWKAPAAGVIYPYTIRVQGVADFDPSIMN
jgi:hypothetical protein